MCVLLYFADWNGLEGDDLNSVVGMLQLEAGLNGRLELYRYDWQPLSYLLGAFLFRVFGDTAAIFALAPLAAATAITVLFLAVSRYINASIPIFLVILVTVPEVAFSGLYYNSSIIAYLLATVALAAIVLGQGTPALVLSSVFLALAILFRLDFVLILPALLSVVLFRRGRLSSCVIYLGIVVGIIALAFMSEVIRWDPFWDTYLKSVAEIKEKQDAGGWDRYTKTMIASVAISPLGLLFYLFGTGFLLTVSPTKLRVAACCIGLCLLPSLYVVKDLLSVKYLLPLMVFLPFLAAKVFQSLRTHLSPRNWKAAYGGLLALTMGLLLASAEPVKRAPYINVTVLTPRQIVTHDGPRSWGAYISQLLLISKTGENDRNVAAGKALTERMIDGKDETLVFVGTPSAFSAGSIGWRHAQMNLANKGFNGTALAENLVRIQVNGSTLWLTDRIQRQQIAEILDSPGGVVVTGEELLSAIPQ